MCTFCGQRVENCTNKKYAILEKNNELSWSKDKAIEVLETEKQRILESNKLILILDLDNTLIHSHFVRENYHYDKKDILPNNKDLYLVYLSPESYYLKLRPFLREFLQAISEKFIIFIYTMGTRGYAEFICKIIDPEANIIKTNRIISRCDNGPDGNERKIIDKIIEDKSITLILDDNQFIWPTAFSDNLIFTKPFFYFDDIPLPNSQEVYIAVRRKEDSFLYFMQELLLKIHKIYFMLYDKHIPADVRDIYKLIKSNLLKDINFTVSGLTKIGQPATEVSEYKAIKDMNGILQNEIDKHTNYLITNQYKRTAKILKAKNNNIPIINKWWISYCQLYSKKLNPKTFEITGPNSEILQRIDLVTRKKDDIIVQKFMQKIEVKIDKDEEDLMNLKNGDNNEIKDEIKDEKKNGKKDEDTKYTTDKKAEQNNVKYLEDKSNKDEEIKSSKELLMKQIEESNTEAKELNAQEDNNIKDGNEAKDKIEILLVQDNPISIFTEESDTDLKEFLMREFELRHSGKRRRDNE